LHGERSRLDLSLNPEVKQKYKFPWTLVDFLLAQPESFEGRMDLAASSQQMPDVAAFDRIIIAYPVWFLSPAVPISAWLSSLPDGSLAGKDVVSICTCRNMWFEAQRHVRRLVEKKGGRIVAHATLEDLAPTAATLVTTPRFFLTGSRSFSESSPAWVQRKFPPFGVTESEYDALRVWSRTALAAPASVALCRPRAPLVLAELVGRRISRLYCAAWPLVKRAPRWVPTLYMLLVAVLTMVSIVVLMPPAAVLGKLPPLRGMLQRLANRVTSAATPSSSGGEVPAGSDLESTDGSKARASELLSTETTAP
jgi:hypothetical protein